MATQGPGARIQSIIQNTADLFASSVDIHEHTVQIGIAYREVRSMEREFQLTQSVSLDTVINEIMAHSGQDPVIGRVLRSVRAQGASIERETRLNIPQLLISTWSLAKTSHYTNAKDVVIDNLRHNIETDGGCSAGISARLVQPYLHFLKSNVDNRFSPQRQTSSSSSTSVRQAEESDLRLALELSMQTARVTNEDRDLQRALELSRTLTLSQPRARITITDEDRELQRVLEMSAAEERDFQAAIEASKRYR